MVLLYSRKTYCRFTYPHGPWVSSCRQSSSCLVLETLTKTRFYWAVGPLKFAYGQNKASFIHNKMGKLNIIFASTLSQLVLSRQISISRPTRQRSTQRPPKAMQHILTQGRCFMLRGYDMPSEHQCVIAS
jgi:hypothetical protein